MENFLIFMSIINAVGIFGSIAFFLFKYKAKIDNAIEGYKKICSIETYIEDLSKFFYGHNHTAVPNSLKDYHRYYQSNSPMKLNDKGEELIELSGFKSSFMNNKELVLSHIKQKLDSKGDDVFFYFAEQYSIDLINEFYEEEAKILDSTRQYIFQNGLAEEKDQILRAFGLYVRDQIILEYGKQKDFEKLFELNK